MPQLSLFLSLIMSIYILTVPIRGLDADTMAAHLQAGKELLGLFRTSTGSLSSWMSTYSDSTWIQDLNIPGTHDSLAWNVNGFLAPFVGTQDLCLFDQLNNGVRFVDLRIGMLHDKIHLYHAAYLLDSNVELVDIFWGLYHWLDHNPTETILVSLKVDNGNNTATLQREVYNLIMNPETEDYWVHNSTLYTLGQARRKLIPILRMYLSPSNIPEYRQPGPNLSSGWADNQANFSISYAFDAYGTSQEVLIEDLYNPDAEDMQAAVEQKMDALEMHLELSMAIAFNGSSYVPGRWFIAFASGYNGYTTTPGEFATGSSIPTDAEGVNSRLLKILKENKGRYFGVIMFDFYGDDLRLANATLGWEVSAKYVFPGHYLL